MRPFILLIAGVVLALPSPARADWMLSAYLGAAGTQPSTAQLHEPGRQTSLEFIDLHYRGESNQPRRYYGYRIGWIPESRRWMAIEAEHVHAKVFAETADIRRVRGTMPIGESVPSGVITVTLSPTNAPSSLASASPMTIPSGCSAERAMMASICWFTSSSLTRKFK